MENREIIGVTFFTNNRVIPFPGDTLRLVIPPAVYAKLVGQGVSATVPLIVSTLVDDDLPVIPEVVATLPSEQTDESVIQFFRYAVVGVILDERRDEILRDASGVMLPLDGAAFIRIDEVLGRTGTTAKVRGRIFFIDDSLPVSNAIVSELKNSLLAHKDRFLDFISFFVNKGETADFVSTTVPSQVTVVQTKINEALALIELGKYIEAAGKVLTAAFMSADAINCDILNMVREASDDGNKDISTDDYLRIANRAFLLALSAAEELYSATVNISEEDRRQITITSISRLQQALEKRMSKLTKTKDMVAEILSKLEEVNPPAEVREYIEREVTKLGNSSLGFWAEMEVTWKHINFLLSIPWNKRAEGKVDIPKACEVLDKRLYGLRRVKERVIEYLATLHHLNTSSLRGTILCFVGPPGTGKTDMARQIAYALGRPFGRIALGGVNDEANIKGHRRTYVGAMPGDIMKAIVKCGVKNPVILLDEIDKMRVGVRGDPVAALMDALDPEFNHQFLDFFVDFSFDLSEVFFICSANNVENIPAPLRDRLEIIEFRPYTYAEKRVIAKEYLLPRLREELECPPTLVWIDDEVIDEILTNYTLESGVRSLNRILKSILMKGLVPHNPKRVTLDNVHEFLKDQTPQTWKLERKEKLVAGMAPTLGVLGESGEGCVTYIMLEPVSISNDDSAEDTLFWTANADSVAQQSVLAGIRAARKIAASMFGKQVGSVKWVVHSTRPFLQTSGTSWGVSAALAALSALVGISLPPDWAYTGEVDILGNAYAVGGIATKVATADIVGFKTLFVPLENKYDIAALDFTPQVEVKLIQSVQDIVTLLCKKGKRCRG